MHLSGPFLVGQEQLCTGARRIDLLLCTGFVRFVFNEETTEAASFFEFHSYAQSSPIA